MNTVFSDVYSLYSNFVGAPHFSSIVKLLGYQGVAVVIEELLKNIQLLVSYNRLFCTQLDAKDRQLPQL